MKIKLFYIHPNNYGNLMMASSFIKNYGDNCGDDTPEFYVDVLDDEELDRVKNSVDSKAKIYREDLFDRKRRGIVGKLQKLLYIPKEISYNKKTYDMCVVLGGDCVSQYYSTQVFVSDMYKFYNISKKKPFYYLGQTMGPFHGYAKPLVKKCLSKSHIYVRDHACYDYMKSEFGFDKLYEAGDLAFLDIPFQDDEKIVKETLKKYVGEKPYITIVASGANRQYTSNEEDYISEYEKIVTNLLDKTQNDVLLLAHVIHVSDSNDRPIIQKIVKNMDKKYMDRIHVVDYLIMPHEARILLGHGKLTITGRMHAAVSSINMGVVPICLSYSVKFKGVIGDEFGLNDYILQCRGDEMWKEGCVSKTVIEMADDAMMKKEQLKIQMHEKLDAVQEKSLDQILKITVQE